MEPALEARINDLVEKLDLRPHPEGGYYREIYRSAGKIPQAALDPGFGGDRNFCTSIYFLLTAENFSAFHRIQQDEIWHFYQGSPIYIHVIDANGNYIRHQVGMDMITGQQPQVVIPGRNWFASEVADEEGFTLVGCTVAPGFDFKDFEMAERRKLVAAYPQHATIITKLTRV